MNFFVELPHTKGWLVGPWYLTAKGETVNGDSFDGCEVEPLFYIRLHRINL